MPLSPEDAVLPQPMSDLLSDRVAERGVCRAASGCAGPPRRPGGGHPTLAAVGQAGGAAPGIGFAIASSVAVDIARQFVATGHVASPHRAARDVSVTPGNFPGS